MHILAARVWAISSEEHPHWASCPLKRHSCIYIDARAQSPSSLHSNQHGNSGCCPALPALGYGLRYRHPLDGWSTSRDGTPTAGWNRFCASGFT